MSYDSEVLADSPVVYLKLNDAPGTTSPPELGSHVSDEYPDPDFFYCDAVTLGADQVVVGAATSAIADPAEGVAYTPDNVAPFRDEWAGATMEIWAYCATQADDTESALLAWGATGNISLARLGGVNYLIAGLAGGLTYAELTDVDVIHHIVSVCSADGSESLTYVDGVEFMSAPATNLNPLTYALSIGGDYEGGSWSTSASPTTRISSAALYVGALSATRVAAHYVAGTGGGPPSAMLSSAGQTAVTATAVGRTPVEGSATAAGRTSVRAVAYSLLAHASDQRTVGGVVLTMTAPAVVGGAPTVPAYWARLTQTITAVEGPTHIHSIPDPNPVWNPYTGGWFSPPPPVKASAQPWAARWSVNDLPDPSHYAAGYYWLGDPSTSDGTSNIQSGARQWNPDPSTPHAPPWSSHYPFKPSVTAVNHYLQGGGIVHHPKGVNFNSHFIEHMWTVFPSAMGQPFTWVIAGMVASWPSTSYVHSILDAGVNPGSLGVHLSAEDCDTARRLHEGTSNRSVLRVSTHEMTMTDHSVSRVVRCRVNTHLRPCMFIGIFNGANSYTGMYAPGSKRLQKGRLSGDPSHYYILGRQNGWLDQRRASHLMLFEMRFFTKALDRDDLDAQYAQLSSSHQFDKYRSM